MDDRPTPPSDFLGSCRALGENLLATIEDRLGLFSIELQEEKFRLIQIFVRISAALFAGMMAISFASLTLVYLCWESARLAALGGLTVFYLGTTLALVLTLRRFLARQPSPFAATRQEINSDRACIRNPS